MNKTPSQQTIKDQPIKNAVQGSQKSDTKADEKKADTLRPTSSNQIDDSIQIKDSNQITKRQSENPEPSNRSGQTLNDQNQRKLESLQDARKNQQSNERKGYSAEEVRANLRDEFSQDIDLELQGVIQRINGRLDTIENTKQLMDKICQGFQIVGKERPKNPTDLFAEVITGKYNSDPWEKLHESTESSEKDKNHMKDLFQVANQQNNTGSQALNSQRKN